MTKLLIGFLMVSNRPTKGETPMPSPAVFRRVRVGRGLTQTETALLLGCGQPCVVNYDYGRHKPQRATRERMEALFGMPYRELMAPDNENGADPSKPTPQGEHANVSVDSV